ncbi:MAG: ABC transporter permease [Planctomycetota bacterium]
MSSLKRSIGKVLAIWWRETGAYFFSPMAYLVLVLFVLENGAIFWFLTRHFSGHPRQVQLVMSYLFGFAYYWIIPLSPLLTMRLFAEERRAGTLEVLMTAPVTEAQVVLGKFFAAETFYCLVWLSLTPLLGILAALAIGEPDWGPAAAIYFGLFSLGLLTNALGVFSSSLARNQLAAAVMALSGNLFFSHVLPLGVHLFPGNSDARRFFDYISFTEHFDNDYRAGIVDVRYLVFYATIAAFFLFLSVRAVEVKKP